MTRKSDCDHSPSFIPPVIAILILSVAFVTLAQTTSTGRHPAKQAVTSALPDAAPSPVSEPVTKAGRATGGGLRNALQGASPLNENLPFFLPPAQYFVANTSGIPLTAVAIADLNGDGYPDIVARQSSIILIAVTGTGERSKYCWATVTEPSAPGNLSARVEIGLRQ